MTAISGRINLSSRDCIDLSVNLFGSLSNKSILVFHLNKSINFTASVSDDDEDDEWLPCFNQSIDYIKGKDDWYKGITRIFDCTCEEVLHGK